MKKYLFGLLTLLLLNGCHEEVIKSPAEVTAQKIADIIKSRNLVSADVYEWSTAGGTGIYAQYATHQAFKIEGQFLIVGTYYYNFDKLEKFNSDVVAEFYFK